MPESNKMSSKNLSSVNLQIFTERRQNNLVNMIDLKQMKPIRVKDLLEVSDDFKNLVLKHPDLRECFGESKLKDDVCSLDNYDENNEQDKDDNIRKHENSSKNQNSTWNNSSGRNNYSEKHHFSNNTEGHQYNSEQHKVTNQEDNGVKVNMYKYNSAPDNVIDNIRITTGMEDIIEVDSFRERGEEFGNAQKVESRFRRLSAKPLTHSGVNQADIESQIESGIKIKGLIGNGVNDQTNQDQSNFNEKQEKTKTKGRKSHNVPVTKVISGMELPSSRFGAFQQSKTGKDMGGRENSDLPNNQDDEMSLDMEESEESSFGEESECSKVSEEDLQIAEKGLHIEEKRRGIQSEMFQPRKFNSSNPKKLKSVIGRLGNSKKENKLENISNDQNQRTEASLQPIQIEKIEKIEKIESIKQDNNEKNNKVLLQVTSIDKSKPVGKEPELPKYGSVFLFDKQNTDLKKSLKSEIQISEKVGSTEIKSKFKSKITHHSISSIVVINQNKESKIAT